jgi:TonB family protein
VHDPAARLFLILPQITAEKVADARRFLDLRLYMIATTFVVETESLSMSKDKKKPFFLAQPEYPGGPKALSQFLSENVRYPEPAAAAGVEGTVVVEYDIDNRGRVVDTRVVRGLGHGCDEEACRVVRLLKFDVGTNRGVRVVFHKKAQIRFQKPKAAPAPAATMQVNYVVTPSPAPAAEPVREAPAPATYTYTVQF